MPLTPIMWQQLPNDRWMRIKETRTSDGGRIGMRIDITDLKRSEELFRLLLEKNPLPMWVYDQESLRFLAVNDAAIEHYGYSRDEFLAMTVLDMSPAEDREKMRSIRRGVKGGYLRRPAVPLRHLKADGTEIEVAIYAKNLPFEGHAASVVAAIDVTEQRQAERRLAHYARHDPLTNLGNRMALSEHIASCARVRTMQTSHSPSSASISIVSRKSTTGSDIQCGDELLCEVAAPAPERRRRCFRRPHRRR